MWVSQKLEILDLSFDSTCHVPTDQFAATDDLHCDLLTGDFVLCQFYFAKRAFAQSLDFSILIETVVSADGAW